MMTSIESEGRFEIQTETGTTNLDVETDGGLIAVNIDGATPVYVNGTLVYTNKVFVYGTLMPGMERWPFMKFFAESTQGADIEGKLYDTGSGYPVAVFEENDNNDWITGYIVTLDPNLVATAIEALDRIEHTDTGLYRRIPVHVNEHVCWAYHWPWSTAKFDRIDKWVKQEQETNA